MKAPGLFFLLVVSVCCRAQPAVGDDAISEILAFQNDLNKEYRDPEKSPLERKARRHFRGHDFFPVDLRYRVAASLVRSSDSAFFRMRTTTERMPRYRVYGIVHFALMGKNYDMPVYQSEDLMKTREYSDHLFLPFTDLTNGEETYGGGRYIDLHIPKDGKSLTIDFNQAYNPYCAYSHSYSCPLVPQQNHLDLTIRAGVRME
jgi:uncharacterized protein